MTFIPYIFSCTQVWTWVNPSMITCCNKLYAPLAMWLQNGALNVVEVVIIQVVSQKAFCCNFQLQASLLFCLVGFFTVLFEVCEVILTRKRFSVFDQNFLVICFKEMTLAFQGFNSICWLAIISCFQMYLFSVSDRYCRACNP